MSAGPIAVLAGGLDSAVLCVELAASRERVHPLFVRQGLLWEEPELQHLGRFLDAVARPEIAPLRVLDLPVNALYGRHWSLTGEGTPDADTEDAAVYLPGKNLMLIAQAGVWCERNGVGEIALATLAGNPFSDNSPDFYAALERALELALGTRIVISRPFSNRHKPQVITAGRDLPLELTFSCLLPIEGRHCGRCNKCEERRNGFRDAGVPDRTHYDVPARRARVP